MGKGANQGLLNNSGRANSASNNLGARASSDYNYLEPTLQAEATNPEGYTPQQLAYMNTASQQSLGGSVSGATGQSNLQAARTRNAGGYQGAIGSSTRSAQRQLSTNALGIQEQQANVQLAQRQQALSALQGLYGVNTNAALGYLNSSNSALNGENQGSAIANKDLWNSVNNISNIAGGAAAGAGL